MDKGSSSEGTQARVWAHSKLQRAFFFASINKSCFFNPGAVHRFFKSPRGTKLNQTQVFSTSLPLTSTRWVWPTIKQLFHALSTHTKQCPAVNKSLRHQEMPRIEPGAAGCEARTPSIGLRSSPFLKFTFCGFSYEPFTSVHPTSAQETPCKR